MKVRKLAVSLTLALAGAGVLATSLPMGAVAAQSPAVPAALTVSMVRVVQARWMGRGPGGRWVGLVPAVRWGTPVVRA